MFDSDDIDDIDLNKVCRSCLTNTEDMKSLYEEYSTEKCVADVFMSITSLEFIGYYDGLPTQICCDCFLELNHSYKYVLKCRESDKKLRNHLAKVIKKRRFAASKRNSNVSKIDSLDVLKTGSFNTNEATLSADSGHCDRNVDFHQVYIKTEDVLLETSELLEDQIKIETGKDENLNALSDESLNKPIPHLEIKNELVQEIDLVKPDIFEENLIETIDTPIESFFSYRCQQCHNKFPTYMLLLYHFRSAKHKDLEELCRFCSTYHESHKLYLHMQVQHKHRFKSCEISDEAIVSVDTSCLRTATDEKQYSCKICCRTFGQKALLSNHIRLHTREKPYACHVCDHTYNHKVSLKRHLRSHGKEAQ